MGGYVLLTPSWRILNLMEQAACPPWESPVAVTDPHMTLAWPVVFPLCVKVRSLSLSLSLSVLYHRTVLLKKGPIWSHYDGFIDVNIDLRQRNKPTIRGQLKKCTLVHSEASKKSPSTGKYWLFGDTRVHKLGVRYINLNFWKSSSVWQQRL